MKNEEKFNLIVLASSLMFFLPALYFLVFGNDNFIYPIKKYLKVIILGSVGFLVLSYLVDYLIEGLSAFYVIVTLWIFYETLLVMVYLRAKRVFVNY